MENIRRTVKLKIVFIGDEAVGKTSIARRYIGADFLAEYRSTIGADFYIKRAIYNIEPFGSYLFEWIIYDMAGQRRFEVIRPIYYNKAKAAVVVFDVSRPETFRSVPNWIREFWKYSGGKHPFIIVGNKIDLRDKINCVPYEYGARYAKELSRVLGFPIPYVETSAKEGINIEKAFESLARTILRFYLLRSRARIR